MRTSRRLLLVLVGLVVACGACAPARADDYADRPAVVQRVKDAVARAVPPEQLRFADGYYDSIHGDVYIDGDPIVRRLVGDELVPAPTGAESIGPQRRESCGYGVYFHCETLKVTPGCQPTTFYLNYNPTTDHFADPYGRLLNPPEQVSIRNDQGQGYRRVGPRGVRGARRDEAGNLDQKYGFYSVNCLQ